MGMIPGAMADSNESRSCPSLVQTIQMVQPQQVDYTQRGTSPQIERFSGGLDQSLLGKNLGKLQPK
jgi:hypothetical protein